MDAAQRSRVRRTAGFTLLGVTAVILVYCVVLAGTPPPCCGENWNPPGAVAIAIAIGGPTILAAIAVLTGGSVGGIFGGLVSLLFAGGTAFLLTGTSNVPTVVEVGLTVAYGFAGVTSLVTFRARDKPRRSTAP